MNLLRGESEPHEIFNFAKDLSCMHALNHSTQAIYLFEDDPDSARYNKLIITLLKRSSSLLEFEQIITNCFEAHRIWNILDDAELYLACMQTLGRISYYPTLSLGVLEQARILYKGFDLTPMTFCWRLGEGIFSDSKSFSEAQTVLRTIPIYYISLSPTEFGTFRYTPIAPPRFLISNSDKPLYSPPEAIYQAIRKGCTLHARYISWEKDEIISPIPSELQSQQN